MNCCTKRWCFFHGHRNQVRPELSRHNRCWLLSAFLHVQNISRNPPEKITRGDIFQWKEEKVEPYIDRHIEQSFVLSNRLENESFSFLSQREECIFVFALRLLDIQTTQRIFNGLKFCSLIGISVAKMIAPVDLINTITITISTLFFGCKF